ncbi:MAG: RNB domain-containing ribonuclease [Xenococcaceae cyanobacterium MO_167.B52]|nr:RNB domain-containing ribonuclease [Xenococcaceae cyanobacterium MO_167.B52]
MAINHQNFTKSELEQTQNIINLSDFGERPLVKGFTIDSINSLDLDDAIWIENYGDIGRIQVHIADPTEVIEIDSPLDKAVRKRISTLYLSKGIIPMLPFALSEQKLSLLEGETKLTITVEIEIKCTGEIINYRIYESCFVSLGKLSYQEAERISNNPGHNLFLPLQLAQIWAKILNSQRVKNGAFAGIIKGKFYINEDGNLTPISCNSEVLIAEYMILANTVIAQWLAKKSLNSLYRNHLPQGEENQDLIWQSLESEQENQDSNSQYTHCLAKAVYSPFCQGHLALATPYYLHFTSPLRRLADFIVHRIVKAELVGNPSPYSLEEMTNFAELINQFHLDHKQNQANYLKEKRDNQLLKITNYSNLETKDFSRLIELSIRNNSVSEIKNELEIRFKSGQLTNTDLSLILFNTKDGQLKQLALNYINEKIIVNLLNNCPKILNHIKDLRYEEIIYNPEQLVFISRLIVRINNQDLTTAKIVRGKNKKDAKTKAYKLWLQAYVNQELIPDQQLEKLGNELRNPEPENINFQHKLPLSTLNNLCQQKSWDNPNFICEQEDGIFTCTATVNIEDETIIKVGRATKKRTAQNIAADKILLQLNQEKT